MKNFTGKLASFVKRGGGIKKGGIKLPIAILLFAMLAVGGGLAYKAVADSNILTAPNGGESWSGEQSITWDTSFCGTGTEQTEYVDLKYTSGGSQVLIKSNVACSGGSYSWDTSSVGDGNNYQIVLYYTNDYSTNDNSDNPFTIDNTDPTITSGTLTSPKGTEFWAGGNLQTIIWTSGDITDANLKTNPITLEYYDGDSWESIATGEANDGTYDWTVPSLNISTAKVRITATDKAGNTANDESDNDFTIDSTDPVFTSVGVTDTNTFYKAGDTISFTVDLGETGLIVTADLSVLDTGLATPFFLTDNSDGTYTGTTSALSSGTMQEGLKAVIITATDQAGNDTTDNSLQLTIDKTDPTVVITSTEDGTATNANPIPVTITFNEKVVGFEVTDIVVGNGTAGNFISTTNPIFTVDITPAEGMVTVDIAASVATDIAGNGNTVSNHFFIIYDETAPVFTIGSGAGDNVSTLWVNSDVITFTVDHTVAGAGAAGMHNYVFIGENDACNGTTDFSSSGGGISYIPAGGTITVDNEDKTGKYLCLVAIDLAGNFGYESVGPFKIDTAPAIITITDDAEKNYVKSDDVVFTINYGASLVGDTEYVLTDGSCVVDDFDSNSGTAYTSGETLTFNGEIVDDGKYVCLRARDGKGDEEPVETYTYKVTGQLKIDNTAPTNVTDLSSTSHTISTWNKADDIVLTWTGAVDTKSGLDGYSVVCDTTATTLPNEAIDIQEGIQTHTCSDVADGDSIYFHIRSVDNLGNWVLTAEHIGPFLVDASDPEVDAGVDVIANAKFTQDATVNAVISGVASYTWTDETNSGNGAITFGSVTEHPEDTTIFASADDVYTIQLTVIDNAGNSTSDTMTLIWDVSAPTFTVTEDTNAGPVQTDVIKITINEATTESKYGFSNDNVCDNTDTYNTIFNSDVNFSIMENHTDHLCVMATDKAGNTGYEYVGKLNTDNTKPTLSPVVIISNNTNAPVGALAKVGDTITLTFTADEAIQATPTVTIAGNSTEVTVTNTSGNIWTATYIMTSTDTEGTIPFTIDFIDIAGNTGTQVTGTTDSSSVTFDGTAPTVEITSTEAGLTNANPILMTATFSEVVNGFVENDITVGNGTVVAGSLVVVVTDNKVFNFQVTPAGSAITVDIAAGVATDSAGNGNTVATQFSITYDGTAPTVSIVLTDTVLIAGETTTVTFTFSEDPTGFAEEDVTVIENGTLSNFAVDNSDAKVYTAIFTPTPDVEEDTNIITVGTDWTDVAGNAPVGTTSSANYTIETKKPSVILASETSNPTNGLIAVTAKFSEDVTDFDSIDIAVSNGTVKNFAGSDASYTFDVDPTDGANVTVTIEVPAGKAFDLAGNSNTALNQLTYISDTVAPTLPTVSDPAKAIIINADTYIITGTAEANSLVQIYGNSVVKSEQLENNATDYSISVDLTPNDTNNFTVTATDEAGNESGIATVLTITEDSIAPTAPVESKMTVQMNNPGNVDTISGSTGTVEGYAIVKVYKDVAFVETNKIGEETALVGGSFGLIDIGDNQHAIVYVTATDAAGNESLATAMLNDIAAPAIPTSLVLTDPVNNGNKTTVSITGKGEANASIDWVITDESSGAVEDSNADSVDSNGDINITNINVTGLADGILTLTLTLTDSAGNVSVAGTYTATKDVEAPAVDITFPLTGTKVNGNTIITFTGSELTTPQCSINDTNWTACVSGTTKLSAIAEFSTVVEDASFTLYLKDTDTAGNTGTDKEEGITKDTVLPTIINITSNKANGSYTVGEEIDVDITFSESVLSTGDITVTLNTGGTCIISEITTAVNIATCDYTVAMNENTTDLDATVSGTIIDEAGNVMTDFTPDTTLAANKDIVIDTTAPVLQEIFPVAPTPTNNPTPDYVFSSTEVGAITYSGSCSSEIEIATEGNNIIIFNALADGTYSNCEIAVTDETGNVSNILLVTEFTVDTTAPEIINLTPTGIVNYTNPTISADFSADVSGVDTNDLTIKVTGGSIVFDKSYFTVTESGITSNTSGVNLDKDTTYTVAISGLKDGLGNFTNEKSWTFTISSNASEVDDEVLSPVQFPANGAENVAVDTALSLTFYEEMKESTLTDSNIQLRICGTTNSISTITNKEVINGKSKITLTHQTDNLSHGICYYFYVSAGVKDLVDNQLNPSWISGNQSDHEFTTVAEDESATTCIDLGNNQWECGIPLNQGWNLISLPLIPNDSDIEVVLAGVSGIGTVNTVWSYENEVWYSYNSANNTGNTLSTMEDGKGYWIYMNNAGGVLTVSGTETSVGDENNIPSIPSYSVNPSWNLIGFKSVTEITAGDYINNYISNPVSNYSIWKFNKGYSSLSSSDYMEPGYGYWLNVK